MRIWPFCWRVSFSAVFVLSVTYDPAFSLQIPHKGRRRYLLRYARQCIGSWSGHISVSWISTPSIRTTVFLQRTSFSCPSEQALCDTCNSISHMPDSLRHSASRQPPFVFPHATGRPHLYYAQKDFSFLLIALSSTVPRPARRHYARRNGEEPSPPFFYYSASA